MSKNVVKVVIIVGALGAAGAIYATTGRAPKAGVAKDAKSIDCVCTKCTHAFQMPYDEYKNAMNSATAQQTDGEGGSNMKRRRDIKPALLTCPKCGEPLPETFCFLSEAKRGWIEGPLPSMPVADPR